MDFAKELADISVELETKLKLEEKQEKQPEKQEKDKKIEKIEDKIVHVKNVSVLKGKYKNQIAFIKKDIPSLWIGVVPKRVYQQESDFSGVKVKRGEVFEVNNVKYKVIEEFDQLVKLNTRLGVVEVPGEDLKNLFLIEAKVEVKWSPEIEALYMKTLRRIPTYTRNLILGEKSGSVYKIIKTKITEKELVNTIISFKKMFQTEDPRLLALYISNQFNMDLEKSAKIAKSFLQKDLTMSKLEDIIESKMEQVKSKFEYATLQLDAKNEESIQNILKFELDKTYSFNVLRSFYYVHTPKNQHFGLFGNVLETMQKGRTLEFNEQVFLSSKDIVINKKDVMNITIRKGAYKGFKPQVLSFTPRRFILEIQGKLIDTLSNKEKGEMIVPITRNQFLYNDIVFGSGQFAEVVEVQEDSVKAKTVEGKTVELGKNEYTSNGFYVSVPKKEKEQEAEESEPTGELELVFDEAEAEEVEAAQEEDEEAEEFTDEDEEEAIEDVMDEVDGEKLAAFKDVERVTFRRDLTKDEEEIKRRLESIAGIFKIAIDNVYPLVDEISLLVAKITKAVKNTEFEEYFTLNSAALKYLYALVVYRYINTHGFRLYGVNSKRSFSDLLEKKEYFKIQDYRKNIWYDMSWYTSQKEETIKLTKENYSKIIFKMLSNAEKFYSEHVNPINWKVQDPLKDSRESAVALGYTGPSHLEVMTKQTIRGKDKDYDLYIVGKIHDEEQIEQAKIDVADYFSMKEVSQYNVKNVLKEEGEVSRKETWEQIRKIQQTKNYVYRKYSDKLKKEIESESNRGVKALKSELLKNIRRLDILARDTTDPQLKELATALESAIQNEIKTKVSEGMVEDKTRAQKRKLEPEDEQQLDDDLEEKLYKQKEQEKLYQEQFKKSIVKKTKPSDMQTLLNAAKETDETIEKFFKAKPEKSNIKIFDTKRKIVIEDNKEKKYDDYFENSMDWNFN